MIKIKWSHNDTYEADHPLADLCGIYNGRYVDVVSDYNNEWSYFFNGVRIEFHIPSRDEAKSRLIHHIKDNYER